MGQYFPLASLSLNAGLATSSASFLLRLARSENHLQETFALNNGQKIIDLNYRIIGSNEDVLLSRSEIGASEDVFLIVVMGNRLDTEINEEFIDVMMQIVQRNEQVRFMLIGDHSIDFTKYGLDSCVISLGYRKDYMAILKVADMFLNPKRAGGGTGGQNAVLLGVPVITLPNCDVASLLDEPEFICSNYAEFPKCVTKYINDADYHKKVDEACLRVQKKYKKLDNENEIIRMNAIIQDCITKSKKY